MIVALLALAACLAGLVALHLAGRPARIPGAVFGHQPWPPRNRTPRK